ncbi:MAG: TetR/AcrR family transcriptional regulator [Anaerolineales bacterium]
MTREDILHASAQIFRRKGFHATSMQDIADAVGLQKASLYHHIASKQEILLALLDQALDLLIEDLSAVANSDRPPREKLRTAVRTYIRTLSDHADLASVLLLEYRYLKHDLLQRHIDRRDRFEAIWRSLLQEGIESGDFRPVDPTLAGFALLGVQNWMITWYRPGGDLDPDEIAESFADLYLEGLNTNGRVP